MEINLPLKEMTLHEKLAVMELLWEDIAPRDFESPSWHQDILEGRRQRIADGKAQFADWEKAKTEIRKRLR